jgi:hypothetical protein
VGCEVCEADLDLAADVAVLSVSVFRATISTQQDFGQPIVSTASCSGRSRFALPKSVKGTI